MDRQGDPGTSTSEMPDEVAMAVQSLRRSEELLRSCLCQMNRSRRWTVASRALLPDPTTTGVLMSRRSLLSGLALLAVPSFGWAEQSSGHAGTGGTSGTGASSASGHPSTVGVHVATEAALNGLAAMTHAYCEMNGQMSSSQRQSRDASKSVSAEDASDNDGSTAASTDPSAKSISSVSLDSRKNYSGLDDGDTLSTKENAVQMTTQDVIGDFFGATAMMLSMFKSTAPEAAPIVDFVGNMYGVSQAFRTSSSDPEAAGNIGLGVVTGVAANALGKAVFEVAADFVAPPVAVAYGVSANLMIAADFHFVGSYLTAVTKSVFSSLENEFALKQSNLEAALFEYAKSPFSSGL